MLWKKRTPVAQLTGSKLTGLALGLCLVPLAGQAVFADATINTSITTPTSTTIKAQGLKTAVVAATDTGGDADIALRALKAAHVAMARSTGYVVIPANKVAKALQESGTRWPFTPRQFPDVRKKLDKADRALAVTVTPGAGTTATYSAVVELYDLNSGGLVGRGESTYTASADALPLVGDSAVASTTTTVSSAPVLGSFPVPEGTAGPAPAVDATVTTVIDAPVAADVSTTDLRFLAVDGAILRAVAQMNEPAEINGIIVSMPGGYTTRLSKGTAHGLRNGARLEYTVGGRTIAYGTVIDVGKGESLATVAPERAFSLLAVNGTFRTVTNPVHGAAGRTREEIDEREWKKFETEFGLGAGIAGLAYLLFL